jgi:hypothetical protein
MSKKNIAIALFAAALFSAAIPLKTAIAQEHEHHGPTLTVPVDGATVSNPVTVSFGNGEHEHGNWNREGEGETHHGHGQFFVIIDGPAPQPDATLQADATHVPFPEGQHQLTLTLPPGHHSLLLVGTRDGKVMAHHNHPAEPVSITVQ